MGGSTEGGRGLGGGILANVERGPIKVKARGNMNDLVLKHTWGQTYIYIYIKRPTSTPLLFDNYRNFTCKAVFIWLG